MASNVVTSGATRKPLFPKKKVTAPIEEKELKKPMEEVEEFDMVDTTNDEPPECTNSLPPSDSTVRRLSSDCPVS